MKQKKYSVDEKMAVVMAIMKGQKPVSHICKEYGISDGEMRLWTSENSDIRPPMQNGSDS